MPTPPPANPAAINENKYPADPYVLNAFDMIECWLQQQEPKRLDWLATLRDIRKFAKEELGHARWEA